MPNRTLRREGKADSRGSRRSVPNKPLQGKGEQFVQTVPEPFAPTVLLLGWVAFLVFGVFERVLHLAKGRQKRQLNESCQIKWVVAELQGGKTASFCRNVGDREVTIGDEIIACYILKR